MKASFSVIAILYLFSAHGSYALPALIPGPASGSQAGGVERPHYRRVKIFVPDREFLGRVWSAGLDFEGTTGKPGGWMEFIAGPEEIGALRERGIPFEIADEDPASSLAGQLAPAPMDALGFGTGSMGGYYTLAEVEAQLDSMKLAYPALITAKQAVGFSVAGRTIWGAKISDNPDIAEAAEPEVLYTALIHAREPAGMMTVIYYMWWLLEHYGSDPRATYLVDNRQIWFIPVINADGYVYNESTNPSGGGLWRKNRRNNGNGTFGIDLNRNFGPDEMWNAPNGGSSTSTGSDTYRGPNPFSEPETQTLDAFMRLHEIRTCLNYHTHGRLLIYPYGYLSAESGDSLIYREFAFDMARTNRHATGTDLQTVHYSTRGNSDDFMYGDTTKFRTYAMTPEVGSSFWPASGLILPLAVENLEANIHYSMVAGAMAVI
ncbi:MAG TPA: M14 family metallopeptidase, partial [Bacteroidota bacterium]|nr:M14 family metallopeptidase [Bacteroidota bacterium]